MYRTFALVARSPGKKIVYAPREQIENSSDRMFIWVRMGIWDILYFYFQDA